MTLFITENIEIIKLLFLSIAAILAYFQYWSSNKFKRSQYLSELWRKFYTTEKLTYIFQALERNDKEAFKNISESDIYLYLGYLEEIVIFIQTNPFQIHKIHKKEILNLFQFHFFYIYENEETKKIFWSKIIENTAEIDTEINQFYWARQRNFAKICAKKISTL